VSQIIASWQRQFKEVKTALITSKISSFKPANITRFGSNYFLLYQQLLSTSPLCAVIQWYHCVKNFTTAIQNSKQKHNQIF